MCQYRLFGVIVNDVLDCVEMSTTTQSTPEMGGLDTTVSRGFVDSIYGVEAAELGLIVLGSSCQSSGHLISRSIRVHPARSRNLSTQY